MNVLNNPDALPLLLNMGVELEPDAAFCAEKVQAFILYLLEHDLNRLYSLLYRIDVNESKVKEVFYGSSQEIAHRITNLIAERLEQKLESRKKFKQT